MKIRPAVLVAAAMLAVLIPLSIIAQDVVEKGKTPVQLQDEFRALKDPEARASFVRNAAADSKNIGVERFLVSAFAEARAGMVKIAVVQSLAAMGTAASRSAIMEIGVSKDAAVHKEIAAFLSSIETAPEFLEFAKTALSLKKKKYLPMKLTVLKVIGGNEHKALAGLLAGLLKNRSEDLRVAALDAISFSHNEKALKAVGYLFTRDTEKVQLAAAGLLYDINKPVVVQAAAKGLESRYASVKLFLLRKIFIKFISKKQMKAVVNLLADSDDSVRAAAIFVLQRLSDRGAVRLAINKLRNAKPVEAACIKAALEKLTGLKHADYAEWNEWYKNNRDKFDVTRPSEDDVRGPITAGYEKATYFGTEVDSKRVIFVIDTSKSMSQVYQMPGAGRDVTTAVDGEKKKKEKKKGKRKIDYAKEELRNCVRMLDEEVKFNIIAYNSYCSMWKPALVPANGPNRKAAREYTYNPTWEPNGLTNIYDALRIALEDKEVTCIYLLSDGEPTAGKLKYPAKILAFVAEKNKRKVRINTIGFNLKGRGLQLMQDLAKQNNGVFIKK